MNELFLHQAESVNRFLSLERGLDLSDPGTGKTRVQIEVFRRRLKSTGKAALIIAPRSLLKSAWQDDFRKFAPEISCSVARAKNRDQAFMEMAHVYITNTDAVRWLARQGPAFFARFDTLIVDELSAFKHPTSLRSKALAKIKKYFRYRYGLTGTPNSNTITDIWNQVNLLDDGVRLGKSFYQFRASVCTPKQVGPQPNMVKWTDRPGSEEAVSSLIRDITVRHKFELCTDIPDNFKYSIPFELDPAHMKKYKIMEAAAVVQINQHTITAVNAAVVLGKLMQIASGAVYDETGKYHVVDTDRYELIADLIEARQNTLVFFNWQHQRDKIVQELESRKITYVVIDGDTTDKARDEAVDMFQKGFYRVCLAHPQSAAHGLTLTRATSTIWASPTYNLEHFLQGNRRIYRIGQKHKTETIVVLAQDTIEARVFEKLNEKDERQGNLLSLLQELAPSVPA